MSRKEAIIKSATELFAERGFNGTSTAEIAKRAGVAEGTIFHHFKSKESMLINIFDETMDNYLSELNIHVEKADNGLNALEYLIRFHFDFMKKRSKECLLLFRDFPFGIMEPDSVAHNSLSKKIGAYVKIIQKCINQGKKDGSIQKVSTEKTSHIIRALILGLSRQRLLGPISIPNLSEDVIHFCHRSLKESD